MRKLLYQVERCRSRKEERGQTSAGGTEGEGPSNSSVAAAGRRNCSGRCQARVVRCCSAKSHVYLKITSKRGGHISQPGHRKRSILHGASGKHSNARLRSRRRCRRQSRREGRAERRRRGSGSSGLPNTTGGVNNLARGRDRRRTYPGCARNGLVVGFVGFLCLHSLPVIGAPFFLFRASHPVVLFVCVVALPLHPCSRPETCASSK